MSLSICSVCVLLVLLLQDESCVCVGKGGGVGAV